MLSILIRNHEEHIYSLILRIDYVCLSRYRRIGQCRFNLADTIKMAMFSRYVWSFIDLGFGTTYITVFEDNEGAENLAKNPVCTSNSKHIDVRPLCVGAYFFGELFDYSRLSC